MKKIIPLLIFALFLGSNIALAADDKSPIIFIVHPDNPIRDLSQQEIADFYFKRNRYWPDGTKVRFFDQKGSTAQKLWFIQKILKKTPRELDLFWIGEKNYNGQGAPIIAPSDDMVVSSVAALPGAIGYISTAEDLDLSHVRKITVKGVE